MTHSVHDAVDAVRTHMDELRTRLTRFADDAVLDTLAQRDLLALIPSAEVEDHLQALTRFANGNTSGLSPELRTLGTSHNDTFRTLMGKVREINKVIHTHIDQLQKGTTERTAAVDAADRSMESVSIIYGQLDIAFTAACEMAGVNPSVLRPASPPNPGIKP